MILKSVLEQDLISRVSGERLLHAMDSLGVYAQSGAGLGLALI